MIAADTRQWMHADAFSWLCAGTVLASLVFGGGTHIGFLADAALQLASIPLFLVAIWLWCDSPQAGKARLVLVFCAAVAALPLLQLIPLPAWFWSHLPGRTLATETYALLAKPLPWMPISLTPQATWIAALSVIPPLAIFLGTSLLPNAHRRTLSLCVIGFGIVSVFMGLIQVAQGPASPLRLYEFTNPTEAVGFFANRNHFAALLYCITLLSVAWLIDASAGDEAATPRRRTRFDAGRVAMLILGFTIVVVLIAAQAMARSRAGIGLTIAGLFAALLLALSDRRNISGLTPAKMLTGTVVVAMLFAVQFALYRIMERSAFDPLSDTRVLIAHNTIKAALAHMPFGSGLGSFVEVYDQFEPSQDAMLNAYANHAHNDVLEFWLETGVLGIVMAALFLFWLVINAVKIWRRRPAGQIQIDLLLARAATVVIALLLAHSVVDYPLRTGAMMAIMAFACALLVEAPVVPEVQPATASTGQSARSVFARPRAPVIQGPLINPSVGSSNALGNKPGPATGAGEKWVDDIEWPAEWRSPSDKK